MVFDVSCRRQLNLLGHCIRCISSTQTIYVHWWLMQTRLKDVLAFSSTGKDK